MAYAAMQGVQLQQQQQQQPQLALTPFDERLLTCVMRIVGCNHGEAIVLLRRLPDYKDWNILPTDDSSQKNIKQKMQSVRLAWSLFEIVNRKTIVFIPEVAQEAARLALQTSGQVFNIYVQLLTQHTQQAQIEMSLSIHDPEGITRTVSTDQSMHAEQGPVQFPPLRPTLTGGVPSGLSNGTPANIQPPQEDPSIFVPDIRPTSLRKNQTAEQHIRKKIQDLVTTVDPSVKVDNDAEDLLLEIADEFVDSVANFACRLAKHRGGPTLDVRDLQLHLEMHHGIRIPGFSADPPSQPGAATAQALGVATGPGPAGGGTKKGGGASGAAVAGSSAKRSARLAAVSQAKKEARLL